MRHLDTCLARVGQTTTPQTWPQVVTSGAFCCTVDGRLPAGLRARVGRLQQVQRGAEPGGVLRPIHVLGVPDA